jgi:hypothetical protein
MRARAFDASEETISFMPALLPAAVTLSTMSVADSDAVCPLRRLNPPAILACVDEVIE